MDWKVQAEEENAVNDSYASEKNQFEALTKREAHVLALIAENKSNAEIATQESLALSSVKWYVHQIFSKLGVTSRAEAVAAYKSLGLDRTGAPAPHSNLPRQLTSFIGREREISQLFGLVKSQPLVTVTGSGGVGKTRLALQTAEKAMVHFPDGVWLVELASLMDRELVPAALVNALGLKEIPGQPSLQILSVFLRPKHALILLDNCEHVIGAAAELTHELLHACPQLHILATSREILGVEGEYAFRCPSLALPDMKQQTPFAELPKVEALRLFVDRAQRVSPGFTLTEASAAVAVRICRRLDGIPLAIELAVARLRLLSLEQIASRLDDIFRLLTSGSRTELPRHQTLKALIDWSFNLLNEKERLLLLRLSVFAGGWTVEGAEAVCSDDELDIFEVLDLLGQLLDKSLVGMEMENKSGQPRYRMLETIRQYAHDRLVESNGIVDVRERHLDYYLDLSRRADPELRGHNLRKWRDLLDEEFYNMQLALEWAESGSLVKGLNLVGALPWYLNARHPFEGEKWVWRLLSAEQDEIPEVRDLEERRAARGRALTTIALIGSHRVDRNELAREATKIFESLGPSFELDWALALSIWSVRDPRPLEVFRKAGDKFSISSALWPLIVDALSCGNLEQARIYTEESLDLSRQVGYLEGEGILEVLIGWLELMNGNPSRALEHADASMEFEQAAGDPSEGFSLVLKASILLSIGKYDSSYQILLEALMFDRTARSNAGIIGDCGALARAARGLGDLALAEQHCQEMVQYASSVSDAWAAYGRYSHALLAIAQGNYSLGLERLKYLVNHWFGDPQLFPVQLLFTALGIVAAALEQYQRAAVLFGAQDHIHRQLMNISTPVERDDFEKAFIATRTTLGEEAYATAFAEGKAMNLEQALAYARGE